MLIYSLVVNISGDDRSLISKNMDSIAEVAHKYSVPISWALDSRFIRSLGKKIDGWHEKYNDQIVLMLDIEPFLPTLDRSDQQSYAEQIVQMQDELRRHIEFERRKIVKVLPWSELDVAGAIRKSPVLIQILEEMEFKGLWGYVWNAGKPLHENEDYGCPFGYFYPSREAHNVPGEPFSRIVGVPFETPDLTNRSVDVTRNTHHETRKIGNLQGTYFGNANWNRWLGYVQQLELSSVNTDQWQQYLEKNFEWQKELAKWQFMSINDAVSEYRLSFGKTEPTSVFLRNENDKHRFFYYDDECQLFFEKEMPSSALNDQFVPTELRNYVSPPKAPNFSRGSADHCVELNPPLLVKFSPARTREHLVMKFEVESSKVMPYGIALWDIPETLTLIRSDRFRSVRIGNDLIFLRVSLEVGRNQIDVVMSI